MSQLPTTARATVHRPTAAATPVVAPLALLADANAASQELRTSQLRAAGFRVAIARTGFEAIVKASCHVPDLILIGTLADIDPNETGRLLTTCPVTSQIPVVHLTPGRRVPSRTLTQLRRAAG